MGPLHADVVKANCGLIVVAARFKVSGANPEFPTTNVTGGLATPTKVGGNVTLLLITDMTGTAPHPCNVTDVGMEAFDARVRTPGYDCTWVGANDTESVQELPGAKLLEHRLVAVGMV